MKRIFFKKMDCTPSPFLLLFFFQIWIGKSLSVRHLAPRTELRPHQLEPLRHVALIKQEILRQLGKSDAPKTHNPIHKSMPILDFDNPVSEYKVPDISSYHSEPPDNSSDENIIQFSLFSRIKGKKIKVDNVNLLVRVKLKKPRTNKKSTRDIDTKRKKRQRRKKNFKEIDISVYNVTKSGTPDSVITALKSKIRKTKSLKLSIPKDIIQNVLDANKNTLQFFIQCLGCDKKAKMILVHKRRKRKAAKTRDGNKHVKLHKRRPILFVYSHQTTGS
ncbi:uncharacterized protein LOC132744561 isoform X2 [Ruditapes philippinarum]|uniref:uncharacterized protein LOC132744561 isoform X2 n=1 Tax=Ruditapes philippinarum TaxID=129788 RepID=UPI00295A9C31|nr:uncharacterized protein LOC132744561 isoform X2 [Ruditapes philippinarum]